MGKLASFSPVSPPLKRKQWFVIVEEKIFAKILISGLVHTTCSKKGQG
jgi:hypothetical protein